MQLYKSTLSMHHGSITSFLTLKLSSSIKNILLQLLGIWKNPETSTSNIFIPKCLKQIHKVAKIWGSENQNVQFFWETYNSNSAYNFAFIKKLRNNKKFLSSTFININGK